MLPGYWYWNKKSFGVFSETVDEFRQGFRNEWIGDVRLFSSVSDLLEALRRASKVEAILLGQYFPDATNEDQVLLKNNFDISLGWTSMSLQIPKAVAWIIRSPEAQEIPVWFQWKYLNTPLCIIGADKNDTVFQETIQLVSAHWATTIPVDNPTKLVIPFIEQWFHSTSAELAKWVKREVTQKTSSPV